MALKHTNAAPGDFAETVLMPGDPLRAQYIADSYLDGAKRVTEVRNMWGYTGEYKGKPVSVMAHGMGIPSVSIYCHELITVHRAKRLIRVGSCGTSHPDVQLRDIIIAMAASTNSNVNRIRFSGYDLAAVASYSLVQKAVDAAERQGVRYHVGNIFSEDLFYTANDDIWDLMAKYNVLAVEMEAAGMYTIAAEHRVEALAICTVSDDVPNDKALSIEDRQSSFDEMILIALDVAHQCE